MNKDLIRLKDKDISNKKGAHIIFLGTAIFCSVWTMYDLIMGNIDNFSIIYNANLRAGIFLIPIIIGFLSLIFFKDSRTEVLVLDDINNHSFETKILINNIRADKGLKVHYMKVKKQYKSAIILLMSKTSITYIINDKKTSESLKDILKEGNKKASIIWNSEPDDFKYDIIEIKRMSHFTSIFIFVGYTTIFLIFGFLGYYKYIMGYEIPLSTNNIDIIFLVSLLLATILYKWKLNKYAIKLTCKKKQYYNYKRIGQKPIYRWVK